MKKLQKKSLPRNIFMIKRINMNINYVDINTYYKDMSVVDGRLKELEKLVNKLMSKSKKKDKDKMEKVLVVEE